MKAIRLFGVALLTVLLSVSLSSCSKSDDDNGGGSSSASIEGTWYLKAEKWYGWKNGQPDMSNETINKTHGDYDDNRIWVIKKSGSNYILTEKRPSKEKEYTLTSVGNNEYQKGNDKFIVKSVTAKSMEVGYYDNFYKEDESAKEYGIYTFMK